MLSHSVLSDSVTPWTVTPPGSSVHGDSSGKNTGVGGHALLQGIFPTQGSNPDLPHCRQILYHLCHQGSPWILEWVACPFSRGSSRPKNQTGAACIAGGFFTRKVTLHLIVLVKSLMNEVFYATKQILFPWSSMRQFKRVIIVQDIMYTKSHEQKESVCNITSAYATVLLWFGILGF